MSATPVQLPVEAWLLPVELAAFLEAPAADAPAAAPGARRQLGPRHLAVAPETRS
ncbi:hypothetical protein J2S46_000012 [Kitasatospora herbaricolor]|uniref:hypothetical protein n=1 Tax=Kitasatospora herbaricolor TaxID=68217 RepID=UPI001749B2C3|nr:hypothetical protein [Kitasatospora herbaricolor]MDQ0305456.1 hypothetical protein [Kitasatospora herbaricolor]